MHGWLAGWTDGWMEWMCQITLLCENSFECWYVDEQIITSEKPMTRFHTAS